MLHTKPRFKIIIRVRYQYYTKCIVVNQYHDIYRYIDINTTQMTKNDLILNSTPENRL